MDNKIKTSLIAAAVSSVLASNAFAASTPVPANKSLPSFDYNATIKLGKKAQTANMLHARKDVQSYDLNNGFERKLQSDHFNSELNVNTFTWAKGVQKATMVPMGAMDRKSAAELSAKHFATTAGVKHGVTADAMAQAELKGIHDLGRGAIIAKYQQRVNGLEVVDGMFNVLMNQDMELVATTGHFSNGIMPTKPLAAQFELAPEHAINKAFADMGGDEASLNPVGEKANFKMFEGQSAKFDFSDNPRAKRVYYPTAKRMVPAYVIELMASPKGDRNYQAYRHVVSAQTGEILRRYSIKSNDAFSYRVYADSQAPYMFYDSPMGTELTPHPTGTWNEAVTEAEVDMNLNTIENSGIMTNDPWLPADATTTQGNNVDAYADVTAPDFFNETAVDGDGNEIPGDIRPEVTSDKTFDYSYSNTTGAADNAWGDQNVKSAVVNLFYAINHLHDTYYNHGFTEQWGNAQMDNYGRGGMEGDAMHAQGLDHGAFNNANMSTPSDGFTPRMQMYLWQSAGPAAVSVGNSGDLQMAITDGWGQAEFNIEGVAIRGEDGSGTFEGCAALTNAADVAGKIAVIDRGSCEFGTKAFNAQNAGAIGVIIANNDTAAADEIMGMSAGADGGNVTIPTVSVSYNSGQAIHAEIEAGRDAAVLGGSSSFVYRDGTVDNTIVAHEWGHYITHRLTHGGMYVNNQGGAQGEGWGDFIAMVAMVRESDTSFPSNDSYQGTYAIASYALALQTQLPYYIGLRRVPYTTDMAWNALTFKHITNLEPLPDTHPIAASPDGDGNSRVHSSGEIWANSLWESYAAMLNRDDYDFATAQGKMMDYIVAGLKITPVAPTYTEARDAMLAAAIADDLQNYQLMRDAFAKRGMGPAAVAPSRYSTTHSDVTEDFTNTATMVEVAEASMDHAYLGLTAGYCDLDNTLDVGETSALKIVLNNKGTTSLAGLKAQITTDADITLANDGMVEFEEMENFNDKAMAMVMATLNSAGTADMVAVNISFMSDDDSIEPPRDIMATMTVNRDMEKNDDRKADDFEIMDTFYYDWSQYKSGQPATGGHFVHDWTVFTEEALGWPGISNTVLGPNRGLVGELALVTPKVMVEDDGAFSMSFKHYYEFEFDGTAWDGGSIQISIDGGDWMDVTAAGGKFDKGYNGLVTASNPFLGNQPAFIAYPESFDFEDEAINFDDGVLNGKEVQFRFYIATDWSVPAWGWQVDNVSFSGTDTAPWSVQIENSGVCENRPPVVIIGGDQTVEESVGGENTVVNLSVETADLDGTALTYMWSQKEGPAVELNNGDTAMPSFVVPSIPEDTMFKFEVDVSDGMTSSKAEVSVTALNSNTAPTLVADAATVSVNERQSVNLSVTATDPDEQDTLTYTWWVDGVDVGNNSSSYVYTAPRVTEDSSASVQVTVSDGEYTSEPVSISVSIQNSSSGGNMGLLTLLLAPLAFIRRRRVK